MSSFMIFDQSSKLVYLNYDHRFARLVSELILGADAEKCLDTAELKEWIVFYLSQHVEMNRTEEAEYDVSTLEPLEHFLVARKMKNEFVFLHLNYAPSNHEHEAKRLLQNKLNMFCELIYFLFGNVPAKLSQHVELERILLKLLDGWEQVQSDVSFMLESNELMFVGHDIHEQCKSVTTQIDYRTKQESFECIHEDSAYLLMYRDRFIYQSINNLEREDMQLIRLLSIALKLSNPSAGDCYQYLIFLKCVSNGNTLYIPHVYRLIMVTSELYMICLAEISSILIITVPALLGTVIKMKNHLVEKDEEEELALKKSMYDLFYCLHNTHQHIEHNRVDYPRQPTLINLNHLKRLAELSRQKSTTTTTNNWRLVKEQLERIMTLIIQDLHQFYDQVIFTHLSTCLFRNRAKLFDTIADDVVKYIYQQFQLSLDYIDLRYNYVGDFDVVFQDHPNLLAFVFANNNDNYFVKASRCDINTPDVFQELVRLCHQRIELADGQGNLLWQCNDRVYAHLRGHDLKKTVRVKNEASENVPKASIECRMYCVFEADGHGDLEAAQERSDRIYGAVAKILTLQSETLFK